MSIIHKSKDGRLHIYVRQDMYKGKLKSENWVGRTFVDKKQKVISSGTKNLDEAKVILEKWYDDLVSGALEAKNQENNHDRAADDLIPRWPRNLCHFCFNSDKEICNARCIDHSKTHPNANGE